MMNYMFDIEGRLDKAMNAIKCGILVIMVLISGRLAIAAGIITYDVCKTVITTEYSITDIELDLNELEVRVDYDYNDGKPHSLCSIYSGLL